MIGSLIGAGIGAVGSILGGIAARKEAKKQQQAIQAQKAQNEAWYNRRYNEDPTQRASAIAALTLMEEQLKKRNKAAQGAAAVTGGTEESVAAAQQAGAQALADTTSNIAAAGDAQKDSIEQQYRAQNANYDAQLNNIQAAKVGSISDATKGVASAAGSIASVLDEYYDNKQKKNSNGSIS